jgi:CO dehydrogenase/acetyl-CoA synthase gamma subunit (corrinoid Fe-S protein)
LFEADRASKHVIQQLAKENFNTENVAHIDPNFYDTLQEDDRILAHQIARVRLSKLRKYDFDNKHYDRLTKYELGIMETIKKAFTDFFQIIDNIKPVENTELEEKFKEILNLDCERVGRFSTFAGCPCRHCANDNHTNCTSAVLIKAVPNYIGEQHCSCYRLHKSKHESVKEFVPKGLFRKENYSEGDGSALIIDEKTKVVDED